MQDESQKDNAFIGNASSDSEDDTRHEEFFKLLGVLLSSDVPSLNLKIRLTHTWIKISDKNCKIIVDSGSCITIVSSSLISKIGLKTVTHPSPYKVTWVNAALMEVNERCLVPVQFVTYKDKIWCDVISMDGGT